MKADHKFATLCSISLAEIEKNVGHSKLNKSAINLGLCYLELRKFAQAYLDAGNKSDADGGTIEEYEDAERALREALRSSRGLFTNKQEQKEKAALKELREQEPYCYGCTPPDKEVEEYLDIAYSSVEKLAAKGWKITPLYTKAKPAVIERSVKDLVMADGSSFIEYLKDNALDAGIKMNEWTDGYETCRSQLAKIILPQFDTSDALEAANLELRKLAWAYLNAEDACERCSSMLLSNGIDPEPARLMRMVDITRIALREGLYGEH